MGSTNQAEAKILVINQTNNPQANGVKEVSKEDFDFLWKNAQKNEESECLKIDKRSEE